jgi:UDP-3-O-[3-hydroxymyristoyl] glucosamine N-acyltransferase
VRPSAERSEDARVNNAEHESNVINLLVDMGVEFSTEGDTTMVKGVASIQDATRAELAFCSKGGEQALKVISESRAGAIMCKKQLRGTIRSKKGTQLIFLDNPRLTFVRVANQLQRKFTKKGNNQSFIAPTAIIAGSAKIGENCNIGNYVLVGEDCVIGNNSAIHERVTLSRSCRLGENCIIQSGVTLGEDGFAYERHDNATLEKFPHFKGIVLGNNVEICANTNIARGSLTDTIIGEGTKIDAMVHVAHNVSIGKNCMLTAGTVIGGSAALGNYCWTGLNSTIKDHVKLGNNVIVGAGACVIHDVPDDDVVAGVPAKSIKRKVKSDRLFLMAGQKSEV